MNTRESIASAILPECYKQYIKGVENGEHPWHEGWRDGVAIEAVRLADCLIDALESCPSSKNRER